MTTTEPNRNLTFLIFQTETRAYALIVGFGFDFKYLKQVCPGDELLIYHS